MLKLLTASALVLALAMPVLAKPPVRHRAIAAKPGPGPRAATTIAALPDTAEIQQLRRAFEFAFPVYEMMRTRAVTVARAKRAGIDGINKLFPRVTLADAASRDVTTPNNDTLYASAWLDLAGGPVLLDTPPLPGRYHSAALMNLFTDNVAIVGTRSGGDGGRYLIAGPAWQGEAPAGAKLLRSDTNDAWLLIRVLVNGPADLEAAAAATARFGLDASGAKPAPTTVTPTPDPDAPTLLAVVNEALGRGPLPAAVAERSASFAAQGIRPGVADTWAQLPPATKQLWKASLPALRAELKGGIGAVGSIVDGWTYPGPGIGSFGADDAGRARVALGGLAALPRQEALYLTASVDAAGMPLGGGKAFIAHLPARLPVGGFWSLTMYQVEKDGRLFLVDNPLKRFSLGSNTKSLRAERDGSFDIFIQATKPSGERVVNWLPAPKGQFRLVFRAYLPRVELLDGSVRLPPVTVSELIP